MSKKAKTALMVGLGLVLVGAGILGLYIALVRAVMTIFLGPG